MLGRCFLFSPLAPFPVKVVFIFRFHKEFVSVPQGETEKLGGKVVSSYSRFVFILLCWNENIAILI